MCSLTFGLRLRSFISCTDLFVPCYISIVWKITCEVPLGWRGSTGIFIEMVLNLQISLEGLYNFTILVVYGHGMFFYLFRSSLISLKKCFKVLCVEVLLNFFLGIRYFMAFILFQLVFKKFHLVILFFFLGIWKQLLVGC